MIPKILHQTGPTSLLNWHPFWKTCQASWQKQFVDFEYKLWNDEEITKLIQQEYPQYYYVYSNLPVHIMKIDFVRFAFMHKYGGIYCDLDFYCYKNFYTSLQAHELYLLENPYGNDPIENSLFCSVPNHQFWINCMDEVVARWFYIQGKYSEILDHVKLIALYKTVRPWLIFYISGTSLLSSMFRKYKSQYSIGTLSGRLYNNSDVSYDPEYFTRHIHTGLWGKEDRTEEKSYRNNNVNNFDFYTDYSNGNYIKTDEQLQSMLNIERNNLDTVPNNMVSKFKYA